MKAEITFVQKKSHIHEIHINGIKAGLIKLLSFDPDNTASSTEKLDWRVFFWGRYKEYQIDYRKLGVWHPGTNFTLDQMKEYIVDAINSKSDVIFPESKFVEKGYVFGHASNGEILTVSTEYDVHWCKYFALGSKEYLFADLNKLHSAANKAIEKDNGSLWYGDIERVEYRMINAIFDTSYYEFVK